MLKFFRSLKLFFTNCLSLFDVGIIANIVISFVVFLLLLYLVFHNSFIIALVIFVLFLWSIFF